MASAPGLLPGLIAGVMRASAIFGDDPMLYVRAVKLCCAAFSLSVVYVGFRQRWRLYGELMGAILTGLVCAVGFGTDLFRPGGDDGGPRGALHRSGGLSWRRSTACRGQSAADDGRTAVGLAIYLRLQYAPVVAVATVWQNRLAWRRYQWLALGALGSLLPLGVVLDTLTWGVPFHPMWMNFVRNGVQDFGSFFGRDQWFYYFLFEGAAWQFAALLGVFALAGAVRAPLLALICAVTLITHSMVPHKEQRFIYLALAYAPFL